MIALKDGVIFLKFFVQSDEREKFVDTGELEQLF